MYIVKPARLEDEASESEGFLQIFPGQTIVDAVENYTGAMAAAGRSFGDTTGLGGSGHLAPGWPVGWFLTTWVEWM